jgi:hypothetical protein
MIGCTFPSHKIRVFNLYSQAMMIHHICDMIPRKVNYY